MTRARQACKPLPPGLDNLITSQMRAAIQEANLGDIDTRIAEMSLLNRMAQADIAAEVYCDRSTVSRRLKFIEPRVCRAANQINLPQ